MNLLRGIDRLLTRAVGGLLVIFFTLMLGLAVLQVGLRFFLHTGIIWGDVAARNLVIWVGFFGAYLATREDKHFRIDVLTRFLHVRVRSALAALTDLFVGVICYFLLRASISFVAEGFDPEAVAFLGIPQYVIALIVPVGFALMLFQFFVRAMENIAVTVHPTQADPP